MLGVREIKQSLSKYINQVVYGHQRIIIHSRGEPKAALISIADLRRLEAADAAAQTVGVIECWNGQPYMPGAPAAVNRGQRSVADLLIEEREPDWRSYFTEETR